MLKVISILFGALWTCGTAWALGRILLSRLKLKLYREEEHLIGFAAGASLLGLLMFVLGMAHAWYDAAFYLLGPAVLLAAWWIGALKSDAEMLPRLSQGWKTIFLAVYLPCALYAVVWAMAPEFSPDGATYHLGVMSQFYRAHGFIPMPTHMYGQLSQGMDVLWLYAFALGRHSAAALTHCVFLLALPLLMICYGRRNGVAGPATAAALMVFAAPVVAIDGASAYIDVAVAFVLFAGFYAADALRDEPSAKSAVLLGTLAGGAFAAKYTAIVAFPLLLVMLCAALWRTRAPALKPLALYSAISAALALPWLIRNWVVYHNPVAPLFNEWFPNPFITVLFEQDYTFWMRMYPGVEGYRKLPLMLTLNGQPLGGQLGAVFLLAPVALLALRSSLGRRLLFAALMFALPYPMNIGTRFLIPALPLVALAMAVAIPAAAADRVLAAMVLVQAVMGLPPVIGRSDGKYSWHIPNLPLRAALRIEKQEDYLGRVSPEWRIARMVERSTPGDAVVLATTQIAESYTTRPIWVSYQSAEGQRLTDRLYTAINTDFQPNRRLTFDFPRQTLKAVRLVQTAPEGPKDVWPLTELRLFDGGEEIPANPSWKLRASDAPWDLKFAFDGDPVTRWRAWRWLKPGTWVSVELPAPASLSAVGIDASTDHWAVKLRLDGQNASGAWKPLTSEARSHGLAPPIGLRCMATRELLRAGVTHLAVNEDNPYWKDFHQKAAVWGITEAGSESAMHLYRLEGACPLSSSASTAANPPQQP